MYPYIYNSLLKVNGIEGAKAYPIQPCQMIALFDANEDVFYIKQSDAGGFATINTYKFTPIIPKAENEASGELYVTKEELREAIENVKHIISEQSKQSESVEPISTVSK